MTEVLQPFSLIIVVLAMVPALAHALELPGKLRLGRDAYFAVQPIYYPGFTIAGLAEPVAIVLILVLLLATPRGMPEFGGHSRHCSPSSPCMRCIGCSRTR
jgi:hypothetical protein